MSATDPGTTAIWRAKNNIKVVARRQEKRGFHKKIFYAARYENFGAYYAPTSVIKTILAPVGIVCLLVSRITVCHRNQGNNQVEWAPCGLRSLTPVQVNTTHHVDERG